VATQFTDDAVGGLLVQRLAAGTGSPVLVADFPAFSSAPRLSSLISARVPDQPVYLIDPLAALSAGRPYMSLAELAAEAVGSFLGSGPADGPVFVIGYCSAAALALRIATLLARSREVAAVLLRPSWPDTELVRAQFVSLAANLGGGDRACPELDGDPGQCLISMAQLLRADLEALAASKGLDGSADMFVELLLAYRSWLAFLLACRNDSPPEWAGGGAIVTVLTEAQGSISVPGFAPDAFEVRRLPSLDDANPVTPEVVELVVAQLT
jgi:hypothetical protein